MAGEVIESLPEDHPSYVAIAYEEGGAHLALGFTERALDRYEALRKAHERRAQAEPDRADYQRDLSVSYNKVGDLYSALGQGEKAREAYLKALAIAERLAQAEPDRADYQVDLAISLHRVGTAGELLERKHIKRALEVLLRLKEEGHLAPEHEPKITALGELLRGEESNE